MTNLFRVLWLTVKCEENIDETPFVCPEVGGNGNYADPATCRRFYQVYFGIWFKKIGHFIFKHILHY